MGKVVRLNRQVALALHKHQVLIKYIKLRKVQPKKGPTPIDVIRFHTKPGEGLALHRFLTSTPILGTLCVLTKFKHMYGKTISIARSHRIPGLLYRYTISTTMVSIKFGGNKHMTRVIVNILIFVQGFVKNKDNNK